MRNWLFLLPVLCCFSNVLSQDILVLRKDDKEVKCRIITLNDSIVTYRLWKSEDTTTYSVKKFEVLSFLMDHKSQKSKKISINQEPDNADADLLGEYRCGSVVPGYLVQNSGDTLRGLILVKNVALNQLRVQFTDSAGKTTTYAAKDAKGYGYFNVNYERKLLNYRKEITNGQKIEDGSCFLHRSVNGPSKLFRFYTLRFKNATMKVYKMDPPYYSGKLKRQFVITNPDGKSIFTKGRTLKGTLNRVYFSYPEFTSKYPVSNPGAGDLPAVVESFNYWYEYKK